MEHNITFVLFAYNEERRIQYVLRNLQPYGHILVVDNMSTDRTVEISKSFGADVFSRKNDLGWGESEDEVARVLSKVKTNWVYWGSVDELCPRELLEKFVEVSSEDKYQIVYARRKNINYGIEKMVLDVPFQVRLFRRGSIDFKGNTIHNFGRIVCKPEEILRLPKTDKYSVYHFSTYDLGKFELNHHTYSGIEAKQKIDKGKKFSLMRLIIFPAVVFFKFYILNGVWRFGVAGLIMCMEYLFFRFNVAAKMWEIENGVNLESIEKKYDAMKEKLLSDNEKRR